MNPPDGAADIPAVTPPIVAVFDRAAETSEPGQCDGDDRRPGHDGPVSDEQHRAMGMTHDRSWFAVDGALEHLDHDGDSSFRFPEPVAEHVIGRFSSAGDWVFDPFCGFGTTLVVAERMKRNAVGAEVDERRATFAASRLDDPARVHRGSCADVRPGDWPPFELVLTSPPYGSFVDSSLLDSPADYMAGARQLFGSIRRLLAPGAVIAVEAAQARTGAITRPVVWHLGRALSDLFTFQEEIVRVNTGGAAAGLGYEHSTILVFRCAE